MSQPLTQYTNKLRKLEPVPEQIASLKESMKVHESRLRTLFGKDHLSKHSGTPQPFDSSTGKFELRVLALE